jgi:hypothetical protein
MRDRRRDTKPFGAIQHERTRQKDTPFLPRMLILKHSHALTVNLLRGNILPSNDRNIQKWCHKPINITLPRNAPNPTSSTLERAEQEAATTARRTKRQIGPTDGCVYPQHTTTTVNRRFAVAGMAAAVCVTVPVTTRRTRTTILDSLSSSSYETG